MTRSWPPVKNIIVSGGGFAVDQYNFFVMGLTITMMGCTYFSGESGDDTRCTKTKENYWGDDLLKNMALVGAIIGQLTFGYIGDFFGRRKAFIATMCLVTVGSLMNGLTPPRSWWGRDVKGYMPSINAIYIWVVFWQFIAGLGVGGEYPLSATTTREHNKDFTAVSLTFSMQGVGILLAPLLLLLFRAIVGDTVEKMRIVWRLALGFSFVPGIFLIYPRYKMHESKAFQQHKNEVSWKDFKDPIVISRLIGCSASWFLLDVLFYGNSLMQAPVFSAVFGSSGDFNLIIMQALITAGMNWVGYFFGIFFLPRMGLWKMQLMGFIVQAVLFVIIGAAFKPLQEVPALFTILFGFTFLFANFGPNMTTFIMPTTCFETSVRARCHGIAAAAGKLGGVVGTLGLAAIFRSGTPNAQGDKQNPAAFYVSAGVAAVGAIVTVALIPFNAENCTQVEVDYDDADDTEKLPLSFEQDCALSSVDFK